MEYWTTRLGENLSDVDFRSGGFDGLSITISPNMKLVIWVVLYILLIGRCNEKNQKNQTGHAVLHGLDKI